MSHDPLGLGGDQIKTPLPARLLNRVFVDALFFLLRLSVACGDLFVSLPFILWARLGGVVIAAWARGLGGNGWMDAMLLLLLCATLNVLF